MGDGPIWARIIAATLLLIATLLLFSTLAILSVAAWRWVLGIS